MLFYRIVYNDKDSVEHTAWEGTIATAKKKQKELEATHGKFNVEDYEGVDVPTDKPSLLAWLNANVN